jgi:hypothetical protein
MSINLLRDYTFTLAGQPGLCLLDNYGMATVAREGGVMEYAKPAGMKDCARGWEAVYQSDRWQVRDIVLPVGPHIAKLERIWIFQGPGMFAGQLCVELTTAFVPDWYLIPCVSYNGNTQGSGKEPKELSLDGRDWLYSYERTSIPSATFAEREGICSGLFASPESPQSLISSCGLRSIDGKLVHRIFYPEVEEPLVYADTDYYTEGFSNEVTLNSGQAFTATSYVYLCQGAEFRTGWFNAFRFFFETLTVPLKNRFSTDALWDINLSYMLDMLWVDDGRFTGFSVGLLPEGVHSKGASGKHWQQRLGHCYEIGWAGQNYTNALILMQDAITYGNSASLNKAVCIFDLWEKNARVDNGLFYTLYDHILAGRQDVKVDTCNLGWGALQAMVGYETAMALGIDKPNWLDMGLRCCDFFVDAFARHGTLGKQWDLRSGHCANFDGTIGAFMLMPMAKAYQLTGNMKYLETAEKAFQFYAIRDLDTMACHAGALDTDCIDCETAYAMLYSAIRLYEITNAEYYLQSAVKASKFIVTWVFHYDVLPEEGSDFARLNYRTTGGGSVSTQHHHVHNGTLYFVMEWLKLSELTGDNLWRKYALTIWAGAQQLISDGTLELHGMTRPRGSENEAYLHCRWGLDENGNKRHYINDWLVIWPLTFRLLCLTGPDRDRYAAMLDNVDEENLSMGRSE